CQLSATHGRSAPNVVVLVKLVENDVLTKKRRSAIAGIGSPSLENVLVVFEREVTLFQDQVPLGQIERDAARIVIAGVSQLIGDRELIAVGRVGRDPWAKPGISGIG